MNRKSKLWAALVTVVLVAVLAVMVWAAPSQERSQRPWLSHFVGDEVVVTFITAPPQVSRSTKAVLMDAETSGVVLRFGKEEIFFTFANIMTVEPVR